MLQFGDDCGLQSGLHLQGFENLTVTFFTDTLRLPKSAITITHGQTNKRKLLEVIANI